MRINEQKIEAINQTYSDMRRKTHGGVHGLEIRDGINGATIFASYMSVCTVEGLDAMIRELTDMKEAIEKETGIVC